MKKLFIAALSVLCWHGSAEAQQIKYEEYTLDNGLQVILHEDHSSPNVVVSAMYKVGSKNERTDRTGFAHFFEHLLFEGSENIGRGEFDKHVKRAGGYLNANTSKDRTYYYELLPSNQVGMGLWLESERMMHAKVEKIGVETQREVVKEEKRQRYDNRPYATMFDEMSARLYKTHPYKWTPIGSMDHLNAAQLEEFMQFYRTYYVPNNCVLTIAGDINPTQVKKMVSDYFAPIPRGTQAIPQPAETDAEQTAQIKDVIYDPAVKLPAVFYGYKTPKQGSKDYYAMQMLTKALAEGSSSRFSKELVDKQQKALQTGAFVLPSDGPGMFMALGITNMGVGIEALDSAMDVEVERMKTELISEREFEKIRNMVEKEVIDSYAKIEGIAENLATYKTFYGDTGLINSEAQKFLAVTREDIQAVAKQYLDRNRRVVLYYQPKPANNQ